MDEESAGYDKTKAIYYRHLGSSSRSVRISKESDCNMISAWGRHFCNLDATRISSRGVKIYAIEMDLYIFIIYRNHKILIYVILLWPSISSRSYAYSACRVAKEKIYYCVSNAMSMSQWLSHVNGGFCS